MYRSSRHMIYNLVAQPIRHGGLVAIIACATLISCATSQQLPYHGFSDQATLEQKDNYVIKESIGGSLDPMSLAQEDQRYMHDKIAYDRVEEGYYQWGRKLYALGYRDVYYVRDLAPHAFRHQMDDTYDHDLQKGFEDAEDGDTSRK